MKNEITILPPQDSAVAVYSAPQGLDPYIDVIRDEVASHVPDLSTRKGREEIASLAFKVRKSKTALDGLGKKLVDDLKEVPKKIDAERKRMRDALDALADEVRRPLTEWECAEAQRIQKHRDGIEWFRLRESENADLDSAELRATIKEVEGICIDNLWEEFEPEAHRAKAKALESLNAALVAREKYEADQAELERLRQEAAAREQREREERIAREAKERAEREAEAKAKAEREAAIKREQEAKSAAERRELELKLKAEQAEREKLEAQQSAERAAREAEEKAKEAAEAERRRIAEEKAEEERQLAAREADKKHKAAINREAMEAFVAGGMPEECARQAVTLIAKRQIPNIKINY